MPGFLPLADITPPPNRAHRSYCPECEALSVVKLETGARVCVSCGLFVPPDAPAKPSAEAVLTLYDVDGIRPSAGKIHADLGISLVRFVQLVHHYLDDGSADRVNPELAEALRGRRDHLRKLRTVA